MFSIVAVLQAAMHLSLFDVHVILISTHQKIQEATPEHTGPLAVHYLQETHEELDPSSPKLQHGSKPNGEDR